MKLTYEQDGKLQDLACMTVVDTAAEYYEHNERLSEFVQSLIASAYEAGRRDGESYGYSRATNDYGITKP
jgi:hypothetical protein